MTAYHQNKEREKRNEKNLKRDYTSHQKQAQEPEIRGLEVFTTKNKSHLPKGRGEMSLNNRDSKTKKKEISLFFFCSSHPHSMLPNTDQPMTSTH